MDHDHHLSQSITQHLLALMRRAHQSSVEDGQTIGLLAHALAQLRDELAERNETIREARERIQALESQTALQAQKIDELEERSETQPGETLEAYAELLDDDAACDRDEHGEEEEEEEEEVEDSRRGCRGTVEPEVSVKRIIRDQDQTTTELLVQLHVGIGQQSERLELVCPLKHVPIKLSVTQPVDAGTRLVRGWGFFFKVISETLFRHVATASEDGRGTA